MRIFENVDNLLQEIEEVSNLINEIEGIIMWKSTPSVGYFTDEKEDDTNVNLWGWQGENCGAHRRILGTGD